MNTVELPSDLFVYSLVNSVNEKIKAWGREPLSGKGLYYKHHSIAYLALRMYPSPEAELVRTRVIWNISDYPIVKVHPDYKADIEQNILFFVRYMAALRGEVIQLTIEINEVAFDETSTRHHPLRPATIYALVNCFGHELSPCPDESVEVLKERNACFVPSW